MVGRLPSFHIILFSMVGASVMASLPSFVSYNGVALIHAASLFLRDLTTFCTSLPNWNFPFQDVGAFPCLTSVFIHLLVICYSSINTFPD